MRLSVLAGDSAIFADRGPYLLHFKVRLPDTLQIALEETCRMHTKKWVAAYISGGESCTSWRCPGHPTDDRQTHTKSSQQPPDWSKIHLDDRIIA